MNAANKKFRKELSSGTVALLLMSVLDRAEEPMYGYQIGKLVGAGEEETPIVKQGAIYPVLRSLERSGLLSSRREASTSGPPRRYYTVTALGHDTVEEWQVIWRRTKRFVDDALEGIYYGVDDAEEGEDDDEE
jgi:PadR family transcriptional regulator PadR